MPKRISVPMYRRDVGYDAPSGIGTPDGGATVTLPSAVTEAASDVSTTAAGLKAIVNPEASETSYYFRSGRTLAYGSQAPISGEKVSGHTVAVGVTQKHIWLDF